MWEEQNQFNTWRQLIVSVFNRIMEINECSGCSVNLLLTNNNTIRQLNKNFRNIDKATNVLSFPQLNNNNTKKPLSKLKDVNIGDLAMSYDVIIEESKLFNKSFFDRCTHLFVHGVLHLLGMDHIEEDDRSMMESLEIKILAYFGINNPYLVD
ncbi:MAG: rRNA maturation RNase YbeY [Alphaproteobacteria bacterium]|nr:rRNA maturation RNase YbeY [Alphaproteobacteria bacterium]